MIDCRDYLALLNRRGIDYFTGVPDSLLKDICACILNHSGSEHHVVAANEGAAVALAAGRYLATSRPALVYLQNSGLGNMVNPLVSLSDPEVYSIPMLLLIGWRGEPGVKDEPQHVKQGRITLDLLGTLGIPFEVHPESIQEANMAIQRAVESMTRTSAPYALVVRKGTFAPCRMEDASPGVYDLTRESAIIAVLEELGPGDVVVSTTGMTSREVFEYRARLGQGHGRDFLTVGCMGHASQIALGIAGAKPNRRVCCIDGDGAVIMHMGALASIGARKPENFTHVVINNGAHDSVGGQPTAGFSIDIPKIALACGYRHATSAAAAGAVQQALAELKSRRGPALLEIRVKKGARKDLGRPTQSPIENKRDFVARLNSD